MFLLNSGLKTFIAASSISSMVAITGSIKDIQDQSLAFMNQHESIVFTRLDTYNSRAIASESHLPRVLSFANVELNRNFIDGFWKSVRYTDAKGNSEELNYNNLELALVSDNAIVIKGEEDITFNVLHKTSSTLSLIRNLGNGAYEILELEKNFIDNFDKKVKLVKKEMATAAKAGVLDQEANIKTADYELQYAIYSNTKFEGNDVYGSMAIVDKYIDSFEATINPGANNEKSISFSGIELSDVGTFQVCYSNESEETFACPEEMNDPNTIIISGLVNNGLVNFATGPLQGASLQFKDVNQVYEENQTAVASSN